MERLWISCAARLSGSSGICCCKALPQLVVLVADNAVFAFPPPGMFGPGMDAILETLMFFKVPFQGYTRIPFRQVGTGGRMPGAVFPESLVFLMVVRPCVMAVGTLLAIGVGHGFVLVTLR